jgi:hypothetical protein
MGNQAQELQRTGPRVAELVELLRRHVEHYDAEYEEYNRLAARWNALFTKPTAEPRHEAEG